jgi:hypothetical protein
VKGKRLPEDFVMPEDWKLWAQQKRGWVWADVETEAENFTDYWLARGHAATSRDWRRTWQTWIRNSKRPDGIHKGGNSARAGPVDMSEYKRRLERIGKAEG